MLKMEKLSKDDWSNLIHGILFTHKITEKKLSEVLQISVSSLSSWLNKTRGVSKNCKLKIL